MIVKKLKAFNWGKHTALNFDCDGSIVGVLGPNGSGKSTVLTLVEFLITGTTRDKLETYVKDFAGNGGGEMEFQKYGKTGTIMRQVGNTAKRRLEWDGKVYTKAAEVDKIMTELFGADKKALANSVFVNQGTLEDVLFRAGADRRHAFIELVNLSYCATRASQVDVQIKKIGAGIVDLTPARDEALMAKNTAEASLVKIDTDIGTMLDYSGWLGLLRARSTAVNNLNLLQQQLGDLQTKLTLKQEEFNSRASGLTLDDHKAYLQAQENEFSTLQDEAGTYRSIHTELARYRTLQESINTARTVLSRWVTQLATLNPNGLTVTGLNERLQELQATIQGHDKYVGLSERIEAGAVELDRLMTEKGQLGTPPTEAEVKAIEAELIQSRGQAALLKRFDQMQTKISGCMGAACPDKAECPECGLTLANTFELSADELQAKHQLLADLNATVLRLDQELTAKRTALWKHTSETKRLTQLITAQQTGYDRLMAERDKLAAFADIGNAADEISVAMVLRDKIIEVTGERDKAQTQLRTLLQEQNKYPLAKEHWANREQFTSTKLQELLSALEVRKTALQNDRQTVSLLISADGQISNIQTELNQKQSALDAANATVNADLPEGLPPEGKTLEQFEMEMTASEQVRTGLNASRATAAANYQDCNARYQDILTRMEENQVKVDLIRDLTTLKQMLCDDGLPLAYVKHRFEQLTVHTQEALAKMNADFYVGMDPERPLEFSFHRLDTPTSVEMPMNKLSGGQRVRLCISFLMSLQKVLIKDVGLLVLDEPLVHTDENGIDQIVAFLSDMRQELKNSEHQIWVVDHNPKISSALDKRLQLN